MEVKREATVKRVPTHTLEIGIKELRNHEVKGGQGLMELSSWKCGLDARITSLFKSISLILGSPVELTCMLSLGGYPLGPVSVAKPIGSLSCLSSRSYLGNLR